MEELPHLDMKSVFEILGLFHQEGYGSPRLFKAINEVIKAQLPSQVGPDLALGIMCYARLDGRDDALNE